MLRDMLSSFFQSALRWMGAVIGLMLAFVIVGSFSHEPVNGTRIVSHPTSGFEVKPWKGQDTILMLPIKGDIGTGSLNRDKIRQLLQASQQGPLAGKVKALFLEIDSRGGTVDDSEGIYQLIEQYSQLYHVPVFALSDGFCASGGYMIACGAKKIYATPYSIIGSIGTIIKWFNFHEILEKVGVQAFSVSCGEKKDMLDPYKPHQASDEELLKSITDQGYERFATIVSRARPLLTEKVLRDEVGARVYNSVEAKSYGYIDEIVTDRSLVIAALAKEAGLGSDYTLVEIQTVSGWGDFLEAQASFKNILNHIQTSLSQTL